MRIGMDHFGGLGKDEELRLYIERDQSSNKPYKIVRNDDVGRYMVASRDIKAGETILSEYPCSYGPSIPNEPVCLGCYTPLSKEDHIPCNGCGFPVCSNECSNVPEHRDFECASMQGMNFRLDSKKDIKWNGGEESVYGAISPIRALLLRKRDPVKWSLIWNHMSHNEARRRDSFWNKRDEGIWERLKAMMEVNADDYECLQTLLGIFLVNDFEIGIPLGGAEEKSSLIRGIFALASMPNHSCVANCCHHFNNRSEGFIMTMKAVVNIRAGEEITHSYTEPLDPILRRQSLLKIGKFFKCNCVRCNDPTEMSTYSSALLCSSCKKGSTIPSNCQDINSHWQCEDCGHSMTPEEVQRISSRVKSEIEALDVNPNIEAHEAFLSKHSAILHPNHVYMIDRSYVLGKMYGRMEGYEPDSLSNEQFKRKKEICESVLHVLNVITPGKTRKKGMMMYEIHLPLVIMANRCLQEGPNSGVNPKDIKENLRRGLDYLRKGLEILGEEPEDSFEHKIYVSSEESVKQLEDWVKTIESAL